MATFVSDTFTDVAGTLLQNHTGETGATWTKHATQTPADGMISDANRLRSTDGASFGYYYASGVPANAEYDVESLLRYLSDTNSTNGVAGRIATGASTAYFARYNQSGTTARWELYKQVSGTFTLLGSYNQTLSAGVDYALKLESRAAAKKVYIDGVERISSADDVITAAGKAGVWLQGTDSNTTGVHFDNFTATDAAGNAEVFSDAQTPVDWIGSLQVDRQMSLTWVGNVAANGQLPVSWQGTALITSDAELPIDWQAQVQADYQLVAEWLGSAAGSALTPVDWLGALANSGIIPIAWSGIDSDPAFVWLLDRRGTVWILDTRGTVWTLDRR